MGKKQKNANVNKEDSVDKAKVIQPIREAIKVGDLKRVKKLIGTDDDVLFIETTFGSWLHVAASKGKIDIVKWLLDCGLDINAIGGILKASPLKEAASDGHVDVVEYLLSCGAEIDVSDPNRNPLFGAIYGGHADVARVLIDHGIDVTVRYSGDNMQGMDALAFAVERGQTEIIKLIMQWIRYSSTPFNPEDQC